MGGAASSSIGSAPGRAGLPALTTPKTSSPTNTRIDARISIPTGGPIENAKPNGFNPQHLPSRRARRIAQPWSWNWQPLDDTRDAAELAYSPSAYSSHSRR